jgi:hypothetical protein
MDQISAVSKETVKGKAIHQLANAVVPGINGSAVLRLAADVVADEFVTLGADVYEVEIVNTDSTKTLDTAITSVTEKKFNIDAHGLIVGQLFRLENEILKVTYVPATDTDNLVASRGHSGTTAATHIATTAMYKGDGIAAESTIPVGMVATLTPTVFSAALVAVVNAEGTEGLAAIAISVNEILFKQTVIGAAAVVFSEDLSGGDNTIEATTAGDRDKGSGYVASVARTPTAQEVLIGSLHIVVPFTPVEAFVHIRDSSGDTVAWDGAYTIDAANKLVTLGNGGSTDWAATSEVNVLIVG